MKIIHLTGTRSSNAQPVNEDLPENFKLEVDFKKGGLAMPRLSFYSAINRAMARLARLDWEMELHVYQTTVIENVGFTMTSGRARPFYQVKTVLWSLTGVFTKLNLLRHFAEVVWKTKLDPDYIGFGKCYLAIGEQNGATGADNTTFDLTRTDPMNMQNSNPQVDAPCQVHLGLSYVENGHNIPVDRLYNSALYMILGCAPFDASETARLRVFYDAIANFTLGLIAWTEAGKEDLKWWMVLESLWLLPQSMLHMRPGGQWAEVTARLRYGEYNVAKLIVMKGRVMVDEIESTYNALAGEEIGTISGDGDFLPVGNASRLQDTQPIEPS